MTDKLRAFAVSYRCDGRRFAATIHAESFADAERRLSLLAYGRVDGEIVATVGAPRILERLAG